MIFRELKIPSVNMISFLALCASPATFCLIHVSFFLLLVLLLFSSIFDSFAVSPRSIFWTFSSVHYILSPLSIHPSKIYICRHSTLWLPTWMWKSAALLCCPETERRTAAWMSCRLIVPWRSWLRQRGRATITSMLLSPTASTGRLLILWPLTLCRAPQLTFGGWSLTMAAQQWSCSTNSTSQTLPG